MIEASVQLHLDDLYKTINNLKPGILAGIKSHSWNMSNKVRVAMKQTIYHNLTKRTGLMGANIRPIYRIINDTITIGAAIDDVRVPWAKTHVYTGGPTSTTITPKHSKYLTIPLKGSLAYHSKTPGFHKTVKDFGGINTEGKGRGLVTVKVHGNLYLAKRIGKKKRDLLFIYKLQPSVTVPKRVNFVELEKNVLPLIQQQYMEIYTKVLNDYLKRNL